MFQFVFFSQNVILEMDSSLQFLVAIEAAKFSKLPFPSFSLVIFSQQVARIEGFVSSKMHFPRALSFFLPTAV